jgi:hypothetical protein
MPRRPRVLGAGDDVSAAFSARIVMAVTEAGVSGAHDRFPGGLFQGLMVFSRSKVQNWRKGEGIQ